jgi:hypothetical protein
MKSAVHWKPAATLPNPEPYRALLVHFPNGQVTKANFYEGAWVYGDGEPVGWPVLHWAELPKPPKSILPLNVHEDATHSWIEVPKCLLFRFGIADEISPYSYQRGDVAFLEEDEDALIFKNAANYLGLNLKFKTIKHRKAAPCRKYKSYQAF